LFLERAAEIGLQALKFVEMSLGAIKGSSIAGGDGGEVVQLWLWLGGEGFFCGGKSPCGIAAAQLSF
jgi:hypothetical protein